jgi:hypothetical protein
MSARAPRLALLTQAGPWAGALACASYLFRLPALLHASATNSDAAVVGLQAMHVLRGEWSPFLWGSGYQTSADAAVAALFFAALGPTPLALMLSSLTLHVASTLLVFLALRRRARDAAAFLLTLPLVVTTSCLHSYALYPPRELSLTLALAAFCATDAAALAGTRGRAIAWLGLSGALTTLAVTADPYPMLLVPLAGLFALLVAWDVPPPRAMARRAARALAWAGGALAGGVPFVLLRHAPGANPGPLGLTTAMLPHHLDLLLRECLPWAIGSKVYFARNVMDYVPWDAPLAVRVVQGLGAAALAITIAVALLSVRMTRTLPWAVRRLGLVGGLVYPLASGAFLVSVMVMDHFSMRYLAVLALLTPFAALPACKLLGTRRFAVLFAPHLLATAIGGWVGFGPFVDGVLPVRDTPGLSDDLALEERLRERGVTHAMADYWASYRLTLLWRERVVVVPTNPGEDRYRPYREALERAPRFAYIHDRGRSRESLAEAEKELRDRYGALESIRAGAHTALIVVRPSNP